MLEDMYRFMSQQSPTGRISRTTATRGEIQVSFTGKRPAALEGAAAGILPSRMNADAAEIAAEPRLHFGAAVGSRCASCNLPRFAVSLVLVFVSWRIRNAIQSHYARH